MTEFKQIIGRGTRVRDDYGKLFFSILDYTGSATRLFADPDFDGDPAETKEEDIGEGNEGTSELPRPPGEDASGEKTPKVADPLPPYPPPTEEPRKFYFDGGNVQIAAHLVYELDPDGKLLRMVKFTDYTAEKVRSLYNNAVALRGEWADPRQRADVIEKLAERGIDFDELAKTAEQPDADPLDLLCHLAFNAPIRTRRERATRLRSEKKDFFGKFEQEARQVLDELLEKYMEHGTAQFVLPEVLEVAPINRHGNILEIAALFGGPDKLRDVVNELQTLLYAA